MGLVLLGIRLLLAAVFAVAGIAKLLDRAGSRKSIADFGAPESLAGPLAVLLPVAELMFAAALIPVSSAWWGAAGVLALLALFTAAIGISLARGRKPECHCFGQIHSEPVGGKTLVRNVALAALAALIVSQGALNRGPSVMNAFGPLNRMESALLGLAMAVAALAIFEAWALFYMLRQNGRLLVRLETVEGKLGGIPAAAPAQGLPVDSPAPEFSLAALDGGTVTLDMLSESGRPLILFFSEPGCGACDEILPELGKWQREYGDRLSIVPIGAGEAKANRAKAERHDVRNMLLQTDREIARAYLVQGTPCAVLITDRRIASPLALGGEAIRGLVARATLPPPVRKGDLVPSLRFADSTGKTTELAESRGRRRLLLFWNPSCGFCQSMLEDVKAWERNPPHDAPEMVVISAGTLEEIRGQGFRSRVLLDPNFGAGQVFSAEGTPSAVILDEQGRVASDVGVGAQAVLALAGAVPVGAPGLGR